MVLRQARTPAGGTTRLPYVINLPRQGDDYGASVYWIETWLEYPCGTELPSDSQVS
jgi:hypothetical protein